MSKEECERNGCCWAPTKAVDVPWCFHRKANACSGYRVDEIQEHGAGIDAVLLLKVHHYPSPLLPITHCLFGLSFYDH